jgi:hypothetical protein
MKTMLSIIMRYAAIAGTARAKVFKAEIAG